MQNSKHGARFEAALQVDTAQPYQIGNPEAPKACPFELSGHVVGLTLHATSHRRYSSLKRDIGSLILN
jgi:hypothetical protein